MLVFTSLVDFSNSALFLALTFQFLILHLLIFVCKQFHHLYSFVILLVSFQGIIIKHLTYYSLTTHSINMKNLTQMTYSDKWKYTFTSIQLN